MTKLGIKNKTASLAQLDLAIKRLGDTRIALYREAVWELFKHVVRETPQYSGLAVSHWVIGIDAPATFYDPSLGRQGERLLRSQVGALKPLQRGGDTYWARYAREREKPKLALIRRGSRVYISNGSRGDTDNGQSSEDYLASLQNAAYAAKKLRPVNQVYVTVAESALAVSMRYHGKKIDPFSASLPAFEGEP